MRSSRSSRTKGARRRAVTMTEMGPADWRPRRTVQPHRQAGLFQHSRRPNARMHQDGWRVDRAGGEDDLAPRPRRLPAATQIAQPRGAISVEIQAQHMRAGLHAQVRPAAPAADSGRGAAAPSLADRHLQAREAAGGPRVVVLQPGMARLSGRCREGVEQRILVAAALHAQGPPPPRSAPAPSSQSSRRRKYGRVSSKRHSSNSRAPSGRSRPDGRARRPWHWWTSCRPPPCRARTRSRGHRRARPARRRSPSRAAASAGSAPPQRHMDQRIAIPGTGFQHQHAAVHLRAQAVGQHAAGRTGADDDVVVLRAHVLATCLKFTCTSSPA